SATVTGGSTGERPRTLVQGPARNRRKTGTDGLERRRPSGARRPNLAPRRSYPPVDPPPVLALCEGILGKTRGEVCCRRKTFIGRRPEHLNRERASRVPRSAPASR